MNVCVFGDLAGGAIQASAATTIGRTGGGGALRVALRGDVVASHSPCPVDPSHCSATMRSRRATNIDGVPVVATNNRATCGHAAVGSTGVTITRT